jgi:hypothetical protein
VTGINPNTATTSAASTFSGYTPWIRLAANTLTGSGRIVGVLIGTLPISATGGSASSGIPCPSPCPVIGPDAAGAASTTAPVQIGGSDGGTVRRIIVDSSGREIVVGPGTEAGAAVGGLIRVSGWDGTNQYTLRTNAGGGLVPAIVATVIGAGDANSINYPRGIDNAGALSVPRYASRNWLFNGSTWDQQLSCPNQALFNLSGSGNTEIIPLSGSLVPYICSIYFSTTASEDVKLVVGTGANCAGAPADLSGLFKSILGLALDPNSANGPIRGVAANAICLNQSAVQALGGIVTYGYL